MQSDPCRLCGTLTNNLKNMQFGRFILSRCQACGFNQITPEPTTQELDDLYDSLYFQKAKYTDTKAIDLEYSRRHKLIKKAGLSDGSRLLEIGCGAGQFIATCQNQFDWYGIDYSEAGIQEARNRLPELSEEQLTASKIETYEPQRLATFDGILSFDTIEHIYNPHTMLDNAFRWLKPGGKIILSTPDIGSLMARITGKRWPFMTPPEHLSFFTRPSMRQALKKVGFDTMHDRSLGKFANIAFIIYKAGRVGMLPKSFASAAQKIGLGKITVYVPTSDVMYIIAQKPKET